jgi:hypothetical protein
MGVIITDNKVEVPVKVKDNSTLPLAKEVIKLDTFPPGQAATKIIPRATLSVGFRKYTNTKVTAGKRINCDITPKIKALGFEIMALKLDISMPKAMPNIMIAKLMLRTCKPPALKLSLY